MTQTRTICTLDLKVGDTVKFYGAEFKITEASVHIDAKDGEKLMVANGKWLIGAEIGNYFGRNKNFTFQGNHLATVDVI